MQKIPRRQKYRKVCGHADPSSLSSAQAISYPSNPATARIDIKFGISVDHATTIARLAGIRLEVVQ